MSKKSEQKRSGILRRRGAKIRRRLRRKQFEDQPRPIITGSSIHYEMSDRAQGMSCGEIGAIHKLVTSVELDQEIDTRLELLKIHVRITSRITY